MTKPNDNNPFPNFGKGSSIEEHYDILVGTPPLPQANELVAELNKAMELLEQDGLGDGYTLRLLKRCKLALQSQPEDKYKKALEEIALEDILFTGEVISYHTGEECMNIAKKALTQINETD